MVSALARTNSSMARVRSPGSTSISTDWTRSTSGAALAGGLHAMGNPSASAAPDVERVQSVEMDVLPGDRTLAIDEFVRARAETIRYHEALYRSTSLGTRGSWLARPHPLVMDSLGLVTRPVHAYNLGAGVGRDTPCRSSPGCPWDRE